MRNPWQSYNAAAKDLEAGSNVDKRTSIVSETSNKKTEFNAEATSAEKEDAISNSDDSGDDDDDDNEEFERSSIQEVGKSVVRNDEIPGDFDNTKVEESKAVTTPAEEEEKEDAVSSLSLIHI